MACTGKDGERGDDFCTEDRIVPGIAGGIRGKLGHLRPFPLAASHEAARRWSTGSASAHSASAGSHQISRRRPDPTKAVATASPTRSRRSEERRGGKGWVRTCRYGGGRGTKK